MRKDGSEFPVEIGPSPIRTGDRTFVLSAIINITERKSLERQVQQHLETLQKSNDSPRRSNLDL